MKGSEDYKGGPTNLKETLWRREFSQKKLNKEK